MARGWPAAVVTVVIPLLALAILPLALLRWAPAETRRRANRLGLLYLLLLLGLALAVPLATGVARWESDVFQYADGRLQSSGFAIDVLVGVLLLRSLVALGEGLVVAHVAARGPSVVVAAAALYPLLTEICSLLQWFASWCGSIFAAAVNWPNVPEWVPPHAVVVRVGLSYLGPPLVAGFLTGLGALWQQRGGTLGGRLNAFNLTKRDISL